MSDMLVKLYALNHGLDFFSEQEKRGVIIRKPIGPEKHLVIDWVREEFCDAWASETDVAVSREPGACFIAVTGDRLAGVACYDATALGFFGPIGVRENCRGKSIGTALLLACMLDMKLKGYGYAIVGHTEAFAFFEKAVGAVEIKDSTPGVYASWLKRNPE